MAKSLWNDVLEGTFNTEDNGGSDYSAEIESMVTAEPETMVSYVAGCVEGMLAVEAATAMMEGRCAVQYIQGQKEEATATMEGVLRNAWETLKEWVKKAYEAVKKFLKKAWNKMKGYVNVFKAMVTKYNYVLKGKSGSFKVDWVKIDMYKGADVVRAAASLTSTDRNDVTGNKDYHEQLENAFFPEGRQPKPVAWGSVASEAIKVADDGFDKVYSEAFDLGEKTERDSLKAIQEAERTGQKAVDKIKNEERQSEAQGTLNKRVRLTTNVVRTYATMVNTAASLKVRLAVKACRKAIRNQAENSSATYGAESSDFSAVMAELL